MEVIGAVHGVEEIAVLLLEAGQQILLTGHRPQVVDRRLRDAGYTGDEHRPAIGLHAHAGAVAAMHPHIAEQGRVLRVAHHDVAQRAALEADDGDGGVIHLQLGVVEGVPHAEHFLYLAHVPQQQVQLVGRLVDQHAAALAVPGAAPGVGAVVVHAAPAQHVDRAQNGPAKLAILNRLLDPHSRAIEASLADGAACDARLVGGLNDGIAIGQRRGQRLFHRDVQAQFCRLHRILGVVGVGGADADGLHTGGVHQLLEAVKAGHAILLAKGRAAAGPRAHCAHKLAVLQLLKASRVEMPHLAAAHHACLDFTHVHSFRRR